MFLKNGTRLDLPTSKCICGGVLCFWLVLYAITGNIYGCMTNYQYHLFNNKLSDSVPAVRSRLPCNDLPKSLFLWPRVFVQDRNLSTQQMSQGDKWCHNETNGFQWTKLHNVSPWPSSVLCLCQNQEDVASLHLTTRLLAEVTFLLWTGVLECWNCLRKRRYEWTSSRGNGFLCLALVSGVRRHYGITRQKKEKGMSLKKKRIWSLCHT